MGKIIQFPTGRKASFLWAINGYRSLDNWRLKAVNGQVIDCHSVFVERTRIAEWTAYHEAERIAGRG